MSPRTSCLAAALFCLAGCAVPDTDSDAPAPPDSSATPSVEVTTSALAAPGISRELARARAAAISSVRYGLVFRMRPGMPSVTGEVTIGFHLATPGDNATPRDNATPGDVVIDFAGGDLDDVLVNEARAEVRRINNHIIIDAGILREGENTFHATFSAKVAPTGTPLTVYRDKTDGAEYYYTLVVPADAHRLFPCFDQPDIKGTYSLAIDAPNTWKVIANGALVDHSVAKDSEDSKNTAVSTRGFAVTKPLSTYLFAFAAGPFAEIADPRPARSPSAATASTATASTAMRLFARESKVAKLDTERLFDMHDDAVRWLGDYFKYPYPFAKLDMVLVPGFPYGGMEHAGAIFYRESALAFEQKPTEGELAGRSTLIYHEVSHQWFGNLVTMQWFDDLWLKEGFATFMGYTLFETLEPGKHAWLRFHHRVKPRAYNVDGTSGTTPVYQELGNLADAKSAYGAIVYNKAPAILRELNHRLGPATFQAGLQLFLKRHEFANATWRDLVTALEEAAETSAAHWSSRWILTAGMPRVQVHWRAADDKIAEFAIHQKSVQDDDGTWPLQLEVMLIREGGDHERIKAVAEASVTTLQTAIGKAAPNCVLLNPGDVAYGQFLLDPVSQQWLVDHAQEIEDPLVRAVAMSALYETVRESALDPAAFVTVATRLIATEKDAGTHAWLLGTMRTSLMRYSSEAKRAPLLQELTAVLLTQLAGDTAAIKTQTLRFLMRSSAVDRVLDICAKVAAGEAPVDGLEIGKRDRFLAATALLAAGRGRDALDSLVRSYGDEDVARNAYIAGAADPAAKKRYFAGYLNLDEPPEQWVSGSLGNFHWPGQSAASLPFLRPALERVEWVKKNRKVFFMPAWINAFVNGHSSAEALDIVHRFLTEYSQLPIDIRRKILQSMDSLQRAVEIKKQWN